VSRSSAAVNVIRTLIAGQTLARMAVCLRTTRSRAGVTQLAECLLPNCRQNLAPFEITGDVPAARS
jgi:hypothetical protein